MDAAPQNAVDELITAESPHTDSVWVLGRPSLVPVAGTRCRAWVDDCRDLADIPENIRLNPLTANEAAGGPVVWMGLPTSLDELDELLGNLWRVLGPETHIVAGGRIKHMTRSMNDVAGRWFDDVHASLGVRKARVLHISSPRERPAISGQWPRTSTVNGLIIRAHGGVFHTAGLDAGTSLLLDHLDAIAADVGSQAVDLGSGNGVIAAHLARRLPHATIHATDVSWQAVDSTALTAQANRLNVVTHWCDGLADIPDESVDVVVTNPPFHRGTAQDHAPTLAMLADTARVLRPAGTLWCVYNNHLPWASHIQRTVGPISRVGRNRRYTVVRAVRR
ncbi:methyltransferase [Cutibacterium sp. WCA-380-WT-3A]|uniref:Methyltransferase n=1 Tax=Cutibacterium porci TaxID=2605781 RepID=A0A7K0J8K2_9ACTN|nr:methyltransferase [Cutibacterium porci]MSS46281.1 methyltransferase [Cutibacterium porci]